MHIWLGINNGGVALCDITLNKATANKNNGKIYFFFFLFISFIYLFLYKKTVVWWKQWRKMMEASDNAVGLQAVAANDFEFSSTLVSNKIL